MAEVPADVAATQLVMIRAELERIGAGPVKLAAGRLDDIQWTCDVLDAAARDIPAMGRLGMREAAYRYAVLAGLALEGMEAHARCRCRPANDAGDNRGFAEVEALMGGDERR